MMDDEPSKPLCNTIRLMLVDYTGIYIYMHVYAYTHHTFIHHAMLCPSYDPLDFGQLYTNTYMCVFGESPHSPYHQKKSRSSLPQHALTHALRHRSQTDSPYVLQSSEAHENQGSEDTKNNKKSCLRAQPVRRSDGVTSLHLKPKCVVKLDLQSCGCMSGSDETPQP